MENMIIQDLINSKKNIKLKMEETSRFIESLFIDPIFDSELILHHCKDLENLLESYRIVESEIKKMKEYFGDK